MGKTGKRPTKAKGNGKSVSSKKPTPGCYVLSLSVENVRCFGPKQTLDCSDGEGRPRQWTVILGDNGTGKTTLLRMVALHAAINRNLESDWQLLRTGQKITESQIDSCLGELNKIPNDRVTSAIQGMPLLAQVPLTERVVEWWKSSKPMPLLMQQEFDPIGYGSARYALRHDDDQNWFQISPRVKSLMENKPLLDVERWLLDYDHSLRLAESDAKLHIWNQIEETVCRVLSEVSSIRVSAADSTTSKPCVELETKYGWVALRRLGAGYQSTITWVLDLLVTMVLRHPRSENPLAEPAVCLVDEIDLHLHPVWQRKVIGYLSERFPNTQFIVTAHSPLVVQAAASADANIAVLVRSEETDTDGNHYVEIRNNPEDVRNWRLDQILTSDLFGMTSARPAEVEALFKRKHELLAKVKLSKSDQEELNGIEAKIRELPFGETQGDMNALDEVRQSLEMLKKKLAP